MNTPLIKTKLQEESTFFEEISKKLNDCIHTSNSIFVDLEQLVTHVFGQLEGANVSPPDAPPGDKLPAADGVRTKLRDLKDLLERIQRSTEHLKRLA